MDKNKKISVAAIYTDEKGISKKQTDFVPVGVKMPPQKGDAGFRQVTGILVSLK